MMMKMLSRHWVLAIAASSFALTMHAQAEEFRKGEITIDRPYATTTAPGQPNGAIFIKEIRNAGRQPDELIGGRSPVSKSVEVHRMSMENNVMVMREIPGIAIAASGKVSMDRGGRDGYHLMLMGLTQPLKEGDTFAATLVFRNAGEVPVKVRIEKPKAMSGHQH